MKKILNIIFLFISSFLYASGDHDHGGHGHGHYHEHGGHNKNNLKGSIRGIVVDKLTDLPKEFASISIIKSHVDDDSMLHVHDDTKEKDIINGGITSIDQIKNHLNKVNGVMIGRFIYHSPYALADIEKEIFKNENIPSREEIIEQLIPYVKSEINKGTRLNQIMRHTLGLFHGQTGSSFWKKYLSENMCVRDADVKKIDHIMDKVKFAPQAHSSGQID